MANVWHLHRDTFLDDGVLGKLEGGGGLVFETIENPATLIASGEYRCVRDWYHRGDYEAFEILVEGRDRLLIHAANRARELEGCIAPGHERSKISGQTAVIHSKAALGKFMNANKDIDEFTLVITQID